MRVSAIQIRSSLRRYITFIATHSLDADCVSAVEIRQGSACGAITARERHCARAIRTSSALRAPSRTASGSESSSCAPNAPPSRMPLEADAHASALRNRPLNVTVAPPLAIAVLRAPSKPRGAAAFVPQTRRSFACGAEIFVYGSPASLSTTRTRVQSSAARGDAVPVSLIPAAAVIARDDVRARCTARFDEQQLTELGLHVKPSPLSADLDSTFSRLAQCSGGDWRFRTANPRPRRRARPRQGVRRSLSLAAAVLDRPALLSRSSSPPRARTRLPLRAQRLWRLQGPTRQAYSLQPPLREHFLLGLLCAGRRRRRDRRPRWAPSSRERDPRVVSAVSTNIVLAIVAVHVLRRADNVHPRSTSSTPTESKIASPRARSTASSPPPAFQVVVIARGRRKTRRAGCSGANAAPSRCCPSRSRPALYLVLPLIQSRRRRLRCWERLTRRSRRRLRRRARRSRATCEVSRRRGCATGRAPSRRRGRSQARGQRLPRATPARWRQRQGPEDRELATPSYRGRSSPPRTSSSAASACLPLRSSSPT